MSHFAKVENGIVTEVIVAEQDVIDSGIVGDPSLWVQTSYNTQGGKHRLDGTPFRKNFAGKGYTYDTERDAFIPPQPYASWILDEDTCYWNPPVPIPAQTEGSFTPYKWDEKTVNWVIDETAIKTDVVFLGSK